MSTIGTTVNEPITILYHIPSLVIGGTQKRLVRLARGFKERGYRPVVWYSRATGPVMRFLEEDGIDTWEQALTSGDASQLSSAVTKIKQVQPSIFHSLDYYHDTCLDVFAARRAGVDVCFSSRQDMMCLSATPISERVDRHDDTCFAMEMRRTRFCYRVFANCDAVKAYSAARENTREEMFITVRNGIEIPPSISRVSSLRQRLGIPLDALVLGTVATLKPTKGHDVLLEAFAQILKHHSRTYLLLCGDGRMREPIIRQLHALQLSDNVRLLGEVIEMEECFRTFDIYVHASHHEGLPNAVLEAMSYALPVVATNVGGTAEAVEEGVTGFLVESGDADRLAAAIHRLIHDSHLRAAMGAHGRRVAEARFSVTRMLDDYETVYLEAIADVGRYSVR